MNISSPLIQTYCGKFSNQVYESKYHELFVQFVSDSISNTTYSGVEAHYAAGKLINYKFHFDIH